MPPAQGKEPEMVAERFSENSRPGSPAKPDGQASLLIVEDDGSLGAGLARALGMEGYRVEHLDAGESALARIAEVGFDVVVLDIGLPGIDGFEVLRRMRLGGHSMPVLILTARDAAGDRVHGLDLGADDYLTKPFALPELTARVRALIRRRQSDSSPRTIHGPLEMDRAGRRAFLHGTPLDLAAREWAVLQILLEKVEKVVSKESFIESLTNWEEDLSSNAIEVYISRLRAKLEPAGLRIRTVRGFGYMLEEFNERSA
jgi:two-component system, OmpR family, response regulator